MNPHWINTCLEAKNIRIWFTCSRHLRNSCLPVILGRQKLFLFLMQSQISLQWKYKQRRLWKQDFRVICHVRATVKKDNIKSWSCQPQQPTSAFHACAFQLHGSAFTFGEKQTVLQTRRTQVVNKQVLMGWRRRNKRQTSEFSSTQSSFVLSDAVMSPGTRQTRTQLRTKGTKRNTEGNVVVGQPKPVTGVSVYATGNTQLSSTLAASLKDCRNLQPTATCDTNIFNVWNAKSIRNFGY